MQQLRYEAVDPVDNRARQLIREIDEYTLSVYPGMPTYGIEVGSFAASGGIFLLLYAGDALAGCGALRHLDDGTIEVKRMFIREEFRRRGLARRLLEKLEQTAGETGANIMRIETGDAQPQALALYRSAGYADVARYGAYVENPQSICLAKPLPDDAGDAFLRAFEDCSLPEAAWTHTAHVWLAWLCLTRAAAAPALQRIREGISRYNTRVLKRPHKYHETVTVAFTRIVASRIDPLQNWEEFQRGIADILDPDQAILRRYYSEELLISAAARERFVEPDLAALPAFGAGPD